MRNFIRVASRADFSLKSTPAGDERSSKGWADYRPSLPVHGKRGPHAPRVASLRDPPEGRLPAQRAEERGGGREGGERCAATRPLHHRLFASLGGWPPPPARRGKGRLLRELRQPIRQCLRGHAPGVLQGAFAALVEELVGLG